MCWIFAYKWHKDALPILEHGLQRLEYRGYDSAGIMIGDGTGNHQLYKAVGKVSELSKLIHDPQSVIRNSEWSVYGIGIAHTRRATHGGVNEVNTHPHHDATKRRWVVHNGIIENQHKLKQSLIAEWYMFYGQTDTEVIPALLHRHYNGNFRETVEKVLTMLHGAYALVIVHLDTPDEIIGVKRWSPLILGMRQSDHQFFFSSDAQALAGYADEIIYLDDGELVHVTWHDYTIISERGIISKDPEKLEVSAMEASKGDYEHFMRKEIDEQATIMERIMRGRVDFSTQTLMAEAFHGMQDEDYDHIVLVGCGTSYNAAMLGAYWIQELTGIRAYAEIASEYTNKNIHLDDKTLHIFLSQSGETADSIDVLKKIKARGGHTFGIVNVVGSTIANLTDHGLFMRAGYEIGVASTKAFIGQLSCLFLLVLALAKKRNIATELYLELLTALREIPSQIASILGQKEEISLTGRPGVTLYRHGEKVTTDWSVIGQRIGQYHDMFYLGRGNQYPIAAEWSLKIKEISYIHAESYPSGELKHGPLALMSDQVPTVVIAVDDPLFAMNSSTIAEVQARKGQVIAIANDPIASAEWTIVIPRTHYLLAPFLTTIVMQLLAYHTAYALGREIDKPRNLAKSVTVK